MSDGHFYDAYYFVHNCGRPYQWDEEWLGFFGGIADRIVQDIQPKIVLDAGCAMGFLVEEFRKRGIEAWGVDISEYAIQNAHPDVHPFLWVGSVLFPFPQRYNLIVCIEVLEHLRGQLVRQAVANLCQHTDDIIFSSTPLDYKETTHFNVKPPEVWAEMFACNGFYRDVDFDASFITPWAVRFRKNKDQTPALIRNYERKFWLLWNENQDLRTLSLEMEHRLASQDQKLSENQTQFTNLQREMEAIYSSKAWKWVQRWRHLRLKIGL